MRTTSFCLLALAACGTSDPTCATDAACTCSDGTAGVQLCAGDGAFAACACGVDPDRCPDFSTEICDGLDNDCDGVADNHAACPDATVAGTVPFTGGVYLEGLITADTCASEAIQQIWPTLGDTAAGPFECDNDWYRFRRGDGALFRHQALAGIFDPTAAAPGLVPTPPCALTARHFDFDAAGTFYYQCVATVHKTGGAVVAPSVSELLAVLDDGRILATASDNIFAYVILDGAGRELSRLVTSFDDFTGVLAAAPDAATVAGNRAYVAYLRTFPSRSKEIVVFGADETSTWRLVRRVPVTDFGSAQLVLSDGTVLVREQATDDDGAIIETVRVLLPDGTAQELAPGLHPTEGPGQLLVGPRS